jgi:hypothetical protein
VGGAVYPKSVRKGVLANSSASSRACIHRIHVRPKGDIVFNYAQRFTYVFALRLPAKLWVLGV